MIFICGIYFSIESMKHLCYNQWYPTSSADSHTNREKGAAHSQKDRMGGHHRAHTISGLERKWTEDHGCLSEVGSKDPLETI